MLSESTIHVLLVLEFRQMLGLEVNLLLFILVVFGFCLLLCRLWDFTFLPWLQPDCPKELPYWIPCKS